MPHLKTPSVLFAGLVLPALLLGQTAPSMVEQSAVQPVAVIVDRMRREISERGLTLFVTVDHAANARSVADSLPPTTLLLFGHPGGGTALMKCRREIGIDLPLKMLIWEADDGITHVGYTDVAWLAELHRLDGCEPVVARITTLLTDLLAVATRP